MRVMAKDARARFSRRLLVGTVVVGVLILCNLGLFGMLLFRSLSEQELRRVLAAGTEIGLFSTPKQHARKPTPERVSWASPQMFAIPLGSPQHPR